MQVCTSSVAPATQACACRKALLQRLLHGPDWATLAQVAPGTAVTLASQPPGTPGRRFVVAARIPGTGDECDPLLCNAPCCRLGCATNDDGTVHCSIEAHLDGDDPMLSYQPAGLDVQFGMNRASADALKALSCAGTTWLTTRIADKVTAFASGNGWIMGGSIAPHTADNLREYWCSAYDAFTVGQAIELGYTNL